MAEHYSIRAAAVHHKSRHAADGPDPITPGDIGAAPLAAIEGMSATVTGLPSGADPTVTVTGDLTGKTINLGIPRGADGPPGDPGMGYEEGQQLLDQNQTTLDAAQAAQSASETAATEAAQSTADAIRANLATDIGTPGNPAYEALVDVAGQISDPQTAGLITATDTATRAALDTLLDDVEVDLTAYPTKTEVASEYLATADADVEVAAHIGDPATATAAALQSYSRARETHVVPADHGVVGDGVADDAGAIQAALAAAGAQRRVLPLPRTYRSAAVLTPTADHISVDGQGAGSILVDSDSGIRITPPRTSVGTTSAAVAVGATTVTVAGASFAADEHVGKWVIVTDPAVNPVSGDGTVHSRRIVSHTADTFTLDEQIGYPIPAGVGVEVVTPISSVTLRNLTIRRTTPGGADLNISYVDDVILDNVTSIDAGTMGADRGNAISVYHANRVRITDTTVRNAGNFGIFVYHSRDVKVDRCTVVNSGGQFGMQLKDCTSSVISGGLVEDAQESSYNLKCSGLNESHDVSLVDSVSVNSGLGAVELSSITAEGSLSGRRFLVSGTAARGSRGSGLTVITDAGTDPAMTATWKLVGCSVRGAANVGYSITAPGIQLESCDASGCQFEAALVTAADVRIVGGEFRDNCLGYTSGAGRSSEIRSDAARLSVSGTTFVRTSAGKAIRAHRDTASGSSTLLKDTVIRDTAGAFTQDYILSGTSRAIGSHTLDVFAGATTINKIDPTA